MSTPLSFGLIGVGWIGGFHAKTLADRLPDVRLAAVADPDPAAAARLKAPRAYADVAARVKPWTIFNETLIHDFDTLCWLNPGAQVTQVYAQADALVHPQLADTGFLDTAVVQIRFDNGAFAIAEASFQAVYGYDVRGKVFGSGGVLLAGRAPEHAATGNTDLFADAYVAQFAHFVDYVRTRAEPSVTGRDARVALELAPAARESVRTGAPVLLNAVLR